MEQERNKKGTLETRAHTTLFHLFLFFIKNRKSIEPPKNVTQQVGLFLELWNFWNNPHKQRDESVPFLKSTLEQ